MLFAWQWQRTEQKIVMPAYAQKRTLMLSKAWMLCTFLPMFLICAFMYDVGNDYINYSVYFRRIANGQEQSVDLGYKLMNYLIAKMGLNFQWVIIIISLISFALLIIAIHKYSGNYALSYLLFMVSGYFYLLGINQIRQFTAVGIVCLAYQYIEKEECLKYIILVLIAGTFHFTAFILIPFYWILNKKWRASIFFMICMVLLPFNLFYNKIMVFLFATFLPRYLNSNYISKSFSIDIPYLCMILTVFLLTLIYAHLLEEKRYNRIFINCIWIGTIIALFGSWLPEYKRFVYYFFVPAFFILPQIFVVEKRKILRWLVLGAEVAACLLYLVMASGTWSVIPYKSIL